MTARASLRQRIYQILEGGSPDDLAAVTLHRGLVLLILLSVAGVVLESEPALAAAYGPAFLALEATAAFVFTVEYGARLWASVEHPPFHGLPSRVARLRWALSPAALVDLAAVAPFYIDLAVRAELRILLVLRLLRFFKLARYSPGMRSLIEALARERRALFACFIILSGFVLLSAATMHAVEMTAQPDRFGTIPDAMWWAVVTLTTVGYGDVVPVTGLGKVVAGATALMGLVMLALPVGIIATSFAEVIHRSDFVVTWGLVARVPLFNRLSAAEIAEIMRYLRSQVVAPGVTIVRRGDPADAMFFIASGEVEIELPHGPIVLQQGNFFGEIALLEETQRSATVRAVTATRLLALDSRDFRAVITQFPAISAHIRETAETRRLEQAGDAPPAGAA